MLKWTAYPFLRISIAWIIGIVAGTCWPMGSKIILLTLLTFFLIFILLFLWMPRSRFYEWSSFHGLLLLILLFLSGGYHSSNYDESRKGHHIQAFDSVEGYTGMIVDPALETKKFNKTLMEVIAAKDNGKWKKASGKIQLYLPKEFKVDYGDELLIRGQPEGIPPTLNPHEFDYQLYLKRQNIFNQHFIAEEAQIFKIGTGKGNAFYGWILMAREYATKLFKDHIRGKHEQAVALALVIGVKDELDNELLNAYGATGAMHVLAVSGLHVGIVYGFLLMVFGPIRKTRVGKKVFLSINLVALWTYAMLTGFSPSALRATIMLSALVISQSFKRQSSIYNSLFFSAFIILLYNPFMLFSLGFQLSFLAVLGIIYLAPKFNRAIGFKHWLPQKIWLMTSVSLGAQIATLPLTIFTFNKFPVYFWVVNLVVIPAAFIILVSGVAFLVVGSLELLGSLLGRIIEITILCMNKVVFVVESIPGSTIYPLDISSGQTWLLYFFVISFLAFLYYKKFGLLMAAWTGLLLFVVIDLDKSIECKDQKLIVFYSIPGHAAVDFVDGGSSHLYADSALIADISQVNYKILPYHIERRLPCNDLFKLPIAADKTSPGFELVVFHGKTMCHVRESIDKLMLDKKIHTDFLIISNNAVKDLQHVVRNFKTDQIIVNGANSLWLAEKLCRQSHDLNLKCISLLDQGNHIAEL